MKGEHQGRHKAEAMKELNYSLVSCLFPVFAQPAFLQHPEPGWIKQENACQARPQANLMETFSQKRFLLLKQKHNNGKQVSQQPSPLLWPSAGNISLQRNWLVASRNKSQSLLISPVTMHPHDRTYRCLHLQYQRTANSSHSLKWSIIWVEWMNEVKWYSE